MSQPEIKEKDIINMNHKYIRDSKAWNVDNTENIVRWISSCNLNVILLNTYLNNLKTILRVNTLWSLLISSVTSTVSVTQFTISDISEPTLSLVIKIIIFVTSIFTSLITGYIKVEKIQETIETIEEHKNNWSTLMYSLLSELQVPIQLRNHAELIIKEKREEYNAVNSKFIIIPSYVREQVSKMLVEKRYLEETEKSPTCYQSWCEISYCCKINRLHNNNIANTKRKLSLFFNINKILEKEILSLLIYYPNEIKQIIFDNESDILKFKILKEEFNVKKEKVKSFGMTGKKIDIYTPTEKIINIYKNTSIHPNISSSYSQGHTNPYQSSSFYQQQTTQPTPQPQPPPQSVQYIPVERTVEKIVEVPVEKIVEVPVEKIVEKIVYRDPKTKKDDGEKDNIEKDNVEKDSDNEDSEVEEKGDSIV